MPKRWNGPSNGRRQTGVVRKRRALNAFRIDKEDVPEGIREAEEALEQSDNEGVKTDDDEDIDSDEAFDESDEERFSTFKFSGSTSKGGKGKAGAASARGNRANEGSGEEGDESADEDDDKVYMDLSDMLANGQSAAKPSKLQANGSSKNSTNDSEEEGYDDSDESILGESDSEQDDGQLESLSAFVDSLSSKKNEAQSVAQSVSEKPQVDISSELSMNDILASLTDPSLQSFRKSLASQQTSKSKSVGQKLSAPLARPLQERLERQAAYEETKAEITKWQPLVKANREADHLQFPMNEPPKQTKQSTTVLAGTFEPSTSLEKNIDELLRASGIRDEKEITKFEDLAMKKVSIDEVRQRQSQLRAMRELMFRQDQKAKRIAKIKSKAYRKIHKRERERELERRIAEDGSDGEVARERKLKAETARARERMTLRHKNTGDWAKKMLSRGQHDLETRQAISEQIRRGDELQRKILGDDGESGEEENDSGEELEELLNDPNKWGEEKVGEDTPEIRKGVLGMKFMRDAEKRQKQLNTQGIAEIKAAVDEGSDEDEILAAAESISGPVNHGRKTFVPGNETEQSKHPDETNDQDGAGIGEEVVLRIVKNPFHMNESTRNNVTAPKSSTSRMATELEDPNSQANQSNKSSLPSTEPTLQNSNGDPALNPWLSISYKKSSKKSLSDNRITKIQSKRKRDDVDDADARVNIDVSVDAINEKLSAAANEGEDEDSPTMVYGKGKKIAFQQTELINRAFAADGFEQDFATEKEAAIAEDEPKEEDLTLPGWGSWTGQGVKRRATEKKIIKKVPGIEASQRKDAKLKHVIISEKQVKKNQKYMASGVPYPFETREQYERSLSMPVGPEWTTREMYQKITKPRVTVRAGAVVSPLQAPFK